MSLSALELAAVGAAAIAGGAVNAVAGGGTLITFPTLTAVGVPAVSANVTNTMALSPGYLGGTLAQRRDLDGQRRRLLVLVPLAVAFGVAGGALLLATGEELFRDLVPFLILGATALLAVQPRVRASLLRRVERRGGPARGGEAPAAVATSLASVYGGYFGAGLGIILLASLGVTTDDSLVRVNALKQALSLAVNAAAATFFLFSGEVQWAAAGVMAVGALVGGHLGGRRVSRLRPEALRRVVVAIGLVVAVVYLVR